MHPLAPPLERSLRAVAGAMGDAQDPWWIIGSAAVALLGATSVTVADLDVLLSEADAARILPSLGLNAGPGGVDSRFRSTTYARWDAPELPVEFMAGFALRQGEAWVEVAPTTRAAHHLGDVVLYAFDVENTGSVTLTGVMVSDPMISTTACIASVYTTAFMPPTTV